MNFATSAACILFVGLLAGCSTDAGGDPLPAPTSGLAGKENDSASKAIPEISYSARAEDFSDDHAQLPGLMLSFNTLYIILESSATVSDVNALLKELDADIVGGDTGKNDIPGIMQIRIPTTSHAELAPIFESLEANPLIDTVVPEILLTELAVPQSSAPACEGDAEDWTWEIQPSGGNWGLELARVPQIWNLTSTLKKLGRSAELGILDGNFDRNHEDLPIIEFVDSDDSVVTPLAADIVHGTHVAGIAAASFDNGEGIDGVSPVASLRVKRYDGILSYVDLDNANPDTRVINISLGIPFVYLGLDPEGAIVNTIMNRYGYLIATHIYLHGEENLPTIVVAAGNDSSADRSVRAEVSSAFANAAIVHGVGNIIVVENIALCSDCEGGAKRASDSDIGGLVSAPGSQILSAIPEDNYCRYSGTSMASPFVAGLVSYLYAIEPTLTHAQIKELLTASAVDVDGESVQPRVDAWASMMDIDRLTNSTAVLRLWVDIDDGTPDGNQRIDLATGDADTDPDADEDGGIGDGAIDMSDFRRWRDWLLQVENDASLSLDGAADHIKKDINDDAEIGTAEQENVYPRGDFNGDCILSRQEEDKAKVPGAMAATAEDNSFSDLDVLRELFQDDHYDESELPGLIDSADLVISAANCFLQEGVVTVTTEIRQVSSEDLVQRQRSHSSGQPDQIYTLPTSASAYTVTMSSMGSSGELLDVKEKDFTLTGLGSDTLWDPICGPLGLDIVFPAMVTPGEPTGLSVLVEIVDAAGTTEPAAGVNVEVSAAGGTVAVDSGFTNADGLFETTATLTEGNELLTLIVSATNFDGVSVTQIVEAVPTSGPVTVGYRESRIAAVAVFMETISNGSSLYPPPFLGNGDFDDSVTAQDGSTSGTATQISSLAMDPVLGLTGATVDLAVRAQNSGEGAGSEFNIRAESGSSFTLTFSIPAGSFYEYSASGLMSFEDPGLYIYGEYRGPTGIDRTRTIVSIDDGAGTSSADLADSQILGPGGYDISLTLFTSVFLGDTALTKDGSVNFEFTLVPTEEP